MAIEGIRVDIPNESLYEQVIVPQKERSAANAEMKQQTAKVSSTPAQALSAEINGKTREAEINNETLASALELANTRLANTNAQLQYSIHEATNSLMIKVINRETKEVIREVPPAKTLDMFAKILELAGLLVDHKQ